MDAGSEPSIAGVERRHSFPKEGELTLGIRNEDGKNAGEKT